MTYKMPGPFRNYDPLCKELAEYFLAGTEARVGERVGEEDIANLAQSIQDRIEDWLSDYDQKRIDEEESAREGRWAK